MDSVYNKVHNVSRGADWWRHSGILESRMCENELRQCLKAVKTKLIIKLPILSCQHNYFLVSHKTNFVRPWNSVRVEIIDEEIFDFDLMVTYKPFVVFTSVVHFIVHLKFCIYFVVSVYVNVNLVATNNFVLFPHKVRINCHLGIFSDFVG